MALLALAPDRDPAAEIAYAAAPPEQDHPVELVEGIWWLRTRLPFALDHINIWLLDDGDSWTVIDTGYGDEATRALWDRMLAGPLAGKPVARVLVTHFHPDHLGCGGYLCARTDAPLLMSRTEWLMGRMLSLDDSGLFVAAGERFDRRAGLPEEIVGQRRERGNLYRRGVRDVPAPVQRLRAGSEILAAGSRWRVIIGEGHAPEQVTLFCEERNILIGADQILPRITPVVGVWPMTPENDPLGDFVTSLGRFVVLPEDCLVLPSHERPYYGLRPRIGDLRRHHEERLGRTLELCAEPATALEVTKGLFTRPLDLQQLGFAIAEGLAHLHALLHQGRVERWTAEDGADRFRTL
ncbi:MBL fold metallo-hydrolase [Geminicoccaceae bacterium 1502E]|nr:MBL fold metallo-hydrolase [Geminicoccaceae bacterium 1502E]